jgi:hypothetical protein
MASTSVKAKSRKTTAGLKWQDVKFQSFEAALTPKQLKEGEDRHNGSGDAAFARRGTMAVLTRSSDQLLEKAHAGEVTEILRVVRICIKNTETMLQMANMSEARLLVIGAELLRREAAQSRSRRLR